MSVSKRAFQQLNPVSIAEVNHVDRIQELYILHERVDTTLNASVTELFPCLAFNKNF